MTKTMQKVMLNKNSGFSFSRLRNKGREKSKANIKSLADHCKYLASEFASAVYESEGFTSLKPLRRRGDLLGIALFKTNTMYEESPF